MNAVAMAATPSVRRGKYKTYPSSKASDVVWLKDIPAHWPIIRLKYAAPIATTKFTNKPSDLPYIGLENIESGTGRLLPGTPVEEVDGTVGVFSRGDILFSKLRPYLAKVVYATFDGVCSTEVLVFRPGKDVDGRYLFYRLLSDDFINLVNSLTYGAKMPRANPEQIGTISLALPPKIEQHAIVAFLDRETARIDALIAKKERLIELLEEKRSVVVARCVTKGLDSTVPLRDSCLGWLGLVPAHWQVKRLKFAAKLASSSSLQ
jgi:type I restriction enzyme S subunit